MYPIRQKLIKHSHPSGAMFEPLSLDEVKKLANDSSAKNRNFYIAYLALSFYVFVMALSITDKELLLDQRQLPIPLLALGLKPTIWFLVAPSVLFVLYLDVILNLREHLRKLSVWRDATGGVLPSEQVQHFIVDFAFANRQLGAWGKIYHFMLWLSVAMFAPLTLLACLVQFGAFQSYLISGFHLLLVILSLTMATYFMCVWKQVLFSRPYHTATLNDWKTKCRFAVTLTTTWFATLLIISTLAYSWIITCFASGWWLPENADFLLAPRLKVYNSVLISVDSTEKQALELLLLSNVSEVVTIFGNQSKNEQPPSVADLWWRHGTKLDFSYRNLNYANISGSILSRTQFIGANLKGADLTGC